MCIIVRNTEVNTKKPAKGVQSSCFRERNRVERCQGLLLFPTGIIDLFDSSNYVHV